MEIFILILSILMSSFSVVLISNISKKNKECSVSLYRQIGACIFSIPLLFFLGFNFLELSHHLLNIVLLSLFGSLNIGFTFLSFSKMNTGIANFVKRIFSTFTGVIIGVYILKEKIFLIDYIGLLIISISLYLIFLKDKHFKKENFTFIPLISSILAGICFPLGIFYYREITLEIGFLKSALLVEFLVLIPITLFLFFKMIRTKKNYFKINFKDFKIFLLSGIMILFRNISLTYSLRKIDLNIITIVSSSISIFFVILLSFFIIKEKISYSQLIGILIGTLGVLLVII